MSTYLLLVQKNAQRYPTVVTPIAVLLAYTLEIHGRLAVRLNIGSWTNKVR